MLIYILNAENTNLYKIGITRRSVKKRISDLQTGSPNIIFEVYKYESEYAMKIEKMLHRFYKYCKEYGEWFNFENISIEEVKEKMHFFEEIVKNLENGKEESPY